MQKPWSLYNKEDKLRVDDLTPEHVRIILLATATSRMKDWYACQEGDIHWQPVSAIPEFYEDVRQIKGAQAQTEKRGDVTEPNPVSVAPVAPPVEQHVMEQPPVQKQSPRRPLFEDAPLDLKTDPTLQVETASIKERRTARRYPRRLSFKVEHNGQVFQSGTVDVSMSGLSLESPLPAWVPKTFQAELGMNKQSIRVLCAKVDAQKLKIKDSSSWDVIRAWIVNW